MQKAKTVLIIALGWVIYFFSHLMPRDKKLWVFVGWHKTKDRETFADNSKYLFLHVANTKKNIRAIWLARDSKMSGILQSHGYESYDIHSLKGVYYALRAGCTVIDALMQLRNWRYSGGSITIQLWHADGIKKLDRSSAWSFSKLPRILFSPSLYKRFRFFIASSPYIAENFICPSFGASMDEVRITGLPRYDAFFRNIPGAEIDLHTELERHLKALRSKNIEKILFYSPTFRRGKGPDSSLAQLDLPRFNAFLLTKNYHLIISSHPKFSASDWLPSHTFSNISFSNPDYDKFLLLHYFDAIITDYSSMCLEFLLLDKPTIFFVYDLEEYRKNPGLPEEFWGMVPGPRVKTFEELLQAIEAPDTLADERKRVRDILFTFTKGRAAEAVACSIEQEIQ